MAEKKVTKIEYRLINLSSPVKIFDTEAKKKIGKKLFNGDMLPECTEKAQKQLLKMGYLEEVK